MDKLDLILEQLTTMNGRMDALEAGQRELNQIVTVIRDRQDETDAKLEALSMDVHKMHGDVVALAERVDKIELRLDKVVARMDGFEKKFDGFAEEVQFNFWRLDRHYSNVQKDLDRTMMRVEQLEKGKETA